MSVVRVINVLAIGALIGAAVAVYRIKYEATWQAEEVARLQREIARERASISVLQAEWAYLSRPDRVQALTQKHLPLMAADPGVSRQVTIGALPMRPARTDPIADAIASLGNIDVPIATAAKDDPIARAIEAMGLGGDDAAPAAAPKGERMMRALGAPKAARDPAVTGSTQ